MELETHRGEAIYRTRKFTFTSHTDVKNYLVANNVESCGSFWDLMSALTKMAMKNQTGKEIATGALAATRIAAKPLELELVSSMSVNQPLTVELDTLKCPT